MMYCCYFYFLFLFHAYSPFDIVINLKMNTGILLSSPLSVIILVSYYYYYYQFIIKRYNTQMKDNEIQSVVINKKNTLKHTQYGA